MSPPAITRKAISEGMTRTAARQYDTHCPQLRTVVTPWYLDENSVWIRVLTSVEVAVGEALAEELRA